MYRLRYESEYLYWNDWPVQLVELATLDIKVVSPSPVLGIEFT